MVRFHLETGIGQCPECGYEGYMDMHKEDIDDDCVIDVYTCPICNKIIWEE